MRSADDCQLLSAIVLSRAWPALVAAFCKTGPRKFLSSRRSCRFPTRGGPHLNGLCVSAISGTADWRECAWQTMCERVQHGCETPGSGCVALATRRSRQGRADGMRIGDAWAGWGGAGRTSRSPRANKKRAEGLAMSTSASEAIFVHFVSLAVYYLPLPSGHLRPALVRCVRLTEPRCVLAAAASGSLRQVAGRAFPLAPGGDRPNRSRGIGVAIWDVSGMATWEAMRSR